MSPPPDARFMLGVWRHRNGSGGTSLADGNPLRGLVGLRNAMSRRRLQRRFSDFVLVDTWVDVTSHKKRRSGAASQSNHAKPNTLGQGVHQGGDGF